MDPVIAAGRGVIGRTDEGEVVEVLARILPVSSNAVVRSLCVGVLSASVIAALVACCGASVAGAATAVRFGGLGEASGEFIEPRGVAVTQEGVDVYIVDGQNARVERWSAAGAFVSAWGWGVSDGAPAFEVCQATCRPGLEGGGAGEFGERPGGVAVDNSLGLTHGDVYVVDQANYRVEQFAGDGTFSATFGGEVNATKDQTLGATDAEKDVCTAASGDVCKAGVKGSGHGQFERSGRNAISVDPTGRVYVGDGGRVEEFSAAGQFLGEVTMPSGTGNVESVAVDSAKALYVTFSATSGVHKFAACSGVCAGEESGAPRDTEHGSVLESAVGPSDELFVYDAEARHVYEYASNGEESLSLIEEGGFGAIAYGVEANALYVLHPSYAQVRPVPPAGPYVASESESEVLPSSSVLGAELNPEGPQTTTYHFEYGTTSAYGSSTEEEQLSGEPFEDHFKSVTVSDLQPLTTYHFRVVVTNNASQTAFGTDMTFTTLPAVGIESESVVQVTAESAKLATTLNPHGVATDYRFEYGATTAYGNSIPVPNGNAGSGGQAAPFAALVEGLSPGTVYHYRVVAHNGLGTVNGPDRQFVTQSVESRTLLDGRGWEQVSPANKHAVALEVITEEGGVIQAAESGSALAYIAKAPITEEPQGNRSVDDTQLLAERGPSGWSTKDVTTPHEEVVGLNIGSPSEYQLFSPDVSIGLVEPFGKTPLSPPQSTERTPYIRETGGTFTPLVYPGNVPNNVKYGGEEPAPGRFNGGVTFRGASPDLSHVVVSSPANLVEGLKGEGNESLFEWSNGKLELASVMPDGMPAAEEGMSAELGRFGTQVRNAVSQDGTRVFFVAGGHLYVRDMAIDKTVQIDTLAPGAKGGPGEATFQMATARGDKLYFTDTARLTSDATAHEGEADLYMCEVVVSGGNLACHVTDLTVALHSGEPANVEGAVIGSDEAGRYVYFEADGELTPGAAHGECAALDPTQQRPGALCNLYVRDTLTNKTTLVAVVSGLDSPDWGIEGSGANLGDLTARVSGNGEWFAFMSDRSLTGFDNTDTRTGAPDQEVFLYRRSSGGLTCVSCAPSGARPTGTFGNGEPPGLLVDRPRLWRGQSLAGSVPGWTRAQLGRAYYQSRYLSDDGRLFFNSAVGLVSGDSNGRMDVYEFEPSGIGGCGRASGCIGLVSSGESGEESAFLDASSSGNDVFFMTDAKLAASDTDTALDVYDAHVCSSSAPCHSGAASAPGTCESIEQCRAALPSVVASAPPPSAASGGPGNFGTVRPVVHQLTRAQKLKKALAACKKRPKRKRAACTREARRRYGPVKSPKSQKKGGRSN